MSRLYNPSRLLRPRYKHFESIEGVFYNNLNRYKLLSVNGFAVDINQLPTETPFRISRFVRDPRDLVISGYFYHKRGAEPWFRFKNPSLKYWSPINGYVPKQLPLNSSFAEYLQKVPLEEGLIAEIDFRKFHFESLRNWQEHEHIKVFKYEDIIHNEVATFKEIFKFYEVSEIERRLGVFHAKKYALSNVKDTKHVRNANSGQWKKYFTPKVTKYFNEHYTDVIQLLGYELE
jgi:hypothetical protein